MDDLGRIYRQCACGECVHGAADCPECGRKDDREEGLRTALKALAEVGAAADTMAALHDQLRANHEQLVAACGNAPVSQTGGEKEGNQSGDETGDERSK